MKYTKFFGRWTKKTQCNGCWTGAGEPIKSCEVCRVAFESGYFECEQSLRALCRMHNHDFIRYQNGGISFNRLLEILFEGKNEQKTD